MSIFLAIIEAVWILIQVRVKLGQMRDYGVFKDLDWESFLSRARRAP